MTKNKRYILILAFICILVVVLCVLISGNSKIVIEGKNIAWMKDISDETRLSDIMIPGAHNAAASNVPLSLILKCQNYSISDLLNEGYRYLDIRVGVDEVAGEQRLVIYHSFIPCYSRDGIIPRKLTFEDVSEACYDFLAQNPSETIIFMIKYEHGKVSISEFEKLVEREIEKNSDKWLLTNKTPSLKEARGKVVLYRRYEDEALLGNKAGIECIWDEQENTKILDLNSRFAGCNEYSVTVQDMYRLTSDDKWDVFSYVLKNMSKKDNTNGNYPTINFLSTTGTGSVGIPCLYAKNLNKRFMDYDIEGTTYPQWIIVDFGDEKLAEKIIKINF